MVSWLQVLGYLSSSTLAQNMGNSAEETGQVCHDIGCPHRVGICSALVLAATTTLNPQPQALDPKR